MKKSLVLLAIYFVIVLPVLGQKKVDERLSNCATVLREILSGDRIPTSVLDRAVCVAVFPGIEKMAIGIGGSYAHGVLVCRGGADVHGKRGAPVLYVLDQASVGVQLGSATTDFVFLVMNKHGGGAHPSTPPKLTQLNFRVPHPSRLCFTRRVGLRRSPSSNTTKCNPSFLSLTLVRVKRRREAARLTRGLSRVLSSCSFPIWYDPARRGPAPQFALELP